MVPGHIRAAARISRRGQRAPQGDRGPGSKLHLLSILSRAAQLTEPDVFSQLYDGKGPACGLAQTSLGRGYALYTHMMHCHHPMAQTLLGTHLGTCF